MKWDYEIVSDQVVLDLSYRTVYDIFKKNVIEEGYKSAAIRASKNFDVAVDRLRGCNSWNYLDKCDEAYRILLSTYAAIGNVTVDEEHVQNVNTIHVFMTGPNAVSNPHETPNYTVEMLMDLMIKRTKNTTRLLMDILKLIQTKKWMLRSAIKNKIYRTKGIDYITLNLTWNVQGFVLDKSRVNQEMAICEILLNFNGTESIFEVFAKRMNRIIQTYCKFSGTDEIAVFRKIYSGVTDFVAGVEKTGALTVGFMKLFQKSEEKFNTPFSYYERKGW